MLNFIYLIIISPIELIIETVCTFFLIAVRGNYGFAILGVSLFVSFLCLPLYAQAERLQKIEREIRQKMEKRRKSIQKCFKGDEQYMILSMYYRENHYHPLMALRSSMSLLIQIPFFIAAYSFLSHLEVLKGAGFFIISDLGSPDGLLSIKSVSLNILPIIMTLINITSSMIYARKFPLRERVQLYAMAVIFFILLYNSPASLVIYWTCNNIFSLIKTVLYKLKNPKRILKIILIIGFMCLITACIYVVFFRDFTKTSTRKITIAVSLFIIGIPQYLRLINWGGRKYFGHLKTYMATIRVLFILSCVTAWILCGFVIPFTVVASDPSEFSFLTANSSPFSVLFPSIFLSFGVFIFWPLFIYYFVQNKVRIILSFFVTLIVILGINNAFVFQGNYGMLSKTLVFPLGVNFFGTFSFWLLNIVICFIAICIVIVLYRSGKMRILSSLMVIFFIAEGGIAVWKGIEIQEGYKAHREVVLSNEISSQQNEVKRLKPFISLSKHGKNVFVIMLDRAVSTYLPIILEEREDIRSSLSGFVYYPNTLSFFRSTILGAPPIFGGYEYTPEGFQLRKDKLMRDKHNEALLLLPTLFKQTGYDVSVFDLPYVNYQNMPDISFFSARGINSENLMGKYDWLFLEELGDDAPLEMSVDIVLRHNFIMFSLFTIAPPVLRAAIYRNGSYWNAVGNDRQDIAQAINSYSELYYLPKLTEIKNEGNTLTLLVNNLTHSAAWFQYPDYTVKATVTDVGEDHFNGDEFSFQNYHSHLAAFLLLSKWFQMLRDNSVYDNTRIIIVADHDTDTFRSTIPEDLDKLLSGYNPLLLVKDFDAIGDIKTDMAFMTNGDVPLIATKDLISNPRNPFTGKEVKSDKENGVNILINGSTQPGGYSGYASLNSNSELYHVSDNIFDIKNWTRFSWKE
jgi:YidC/Oxa1 family membrane protein insertase